MKYTIEVEAEELGDIVNLLREITRLVRESRIVPGREVQYCMGAYRVVEGDGVWNAAVDSALEKLRAEAKRLHDFGDEYDQLIVDRLNVVAAHVAALRACATESRGEDR